MAVGGAKTNREDRWREGNPRLFCIVLKRTLWSQVLCQLATEQICSVCTRARGTFHESPVPASARVRPQYMYRCSMYVLYPLGRARVSSGQGYMWAHIASCTYMYIHLQLMIISAVMPEQSSRHRDLISLTTHLHNPFVSLLRNHPFFSRNVRWHQKPNPVKQARLCFFLPGRARQLSRHHGARGIRRITYITVNTSKREN